MGRHGDRYVWESVTPVPGDSRHESVRCSIDWFWGKTGTKPKKDKHGPCGHVDSLRIQIDAFAGIDGWRKRTNQSMYYRLGEQLLARGFSIDEADRFLWQAYYAATSETGGG